MAMVSFLFCLHLILSGIIPSNQSNDVTNEPAFVPLTQPTEDPRCVIRSSCENWYNKTDKQRYLEMNCFCDQLCSVYDDCCEDSEHRLKQDPDWPRMSVLPSDLSSCKSVYGIDSGGDSIFKVNRCPSDWDEDEILNMCHVERTSDTILTWPVSDTEGILYNNVYCGLCHGKTPAELLYWKASFDCEDFTEKEQDIRTLITEGTFGEYCTRNYLPPNDSIKIRRCKSYISYCSPGFADSDITLQCEGKQSATAIVYTQMYNYKNKFCAMCNYESQYFCGDRRKGVPGGDWHPPAVYPLSLLLDLNSGFGQYGPSGKVGQIVSRDNKTFMEFGHCPEDHVFDPFAGTCRKVGCGQGYRLVYKKCMPIMETTSDEQNNSSTCLRHILNQTEYTLLPSGDIYVNSSDEILTADMYEFSVGGSILVCTNWTRNYTISVVKPFMEFKFDNAQTILSIIGQIISLVALVIHFAVYSLLPQLRNLAGKNLMCLVASLFIAQFLFLVGIARSGSYGLCLIISVVMHYAFLSAFFWMNVLSVDIFRTFSVRIKPSSTDKHRQAFIRYSAYAWGGPGVIITLSLLLNFATDDGVLRPGYGEGVCWITSRWALLAFFGLPVLLIILINTVLFSMTTFAICKITKATKVVTKGSDKHRLLLYLKLSSIMGLTWLFGFIATLADVPSLWYVFIILNSLQGAFICIAFVCNQKTIGMIREMYIQATDKTSSESTRSTLLTNNKSRSQSVASVNNVNKNNSKVNVSTV